MTQNDHTQEQHDPDKEHPWKEKTRKIKKIEERNGIRRRNPLPIESKIWRHQGETQRGRFVGENQRVRSARKV